jgi:hypothetical protein
LLSCGLPVFLGDYSSMGVYKQLLIIIAILMLGQGSYAQARLKVPYKKKKAEAILYGNFGLYDGPYWGAGAATNYLWGVGKYKQNFKVGIGLRGYYFNARNREYMTSDEGYYSQLRGGTDSIFFPKMQSVLLNPYLAIRIKIKRGIDFGINVDLGGVTFGTTKKGYFHSYEITLTERFVENVQPYGFNWNPFYRQGAGSGSTFNEAYFQFNAGPATAYKVGLNYFVNEIYTKTFITGNGFRFRNNNYMFMAGVVFNLRKHKQLEEGLLIY